MWVRSQISKSGIQNKVPQNKQKKQQAQLGNTKRPRQIPIDSKKK